MLPLIDQAVVPEVLYDSGCSASQWDEVLDALDRWSCRTQQHVNHFRTLDRYGYRTRVLLTKLREPTSTENTLTRITLAAMGRNLSQNGIGIVLAPLYMPRLLSDAVEFLRSEAVFRLGDEVDVTLQPHTEVFISIHAKVRRIRLVHAKFIELGLKFVRRYQSNLSSGGPLCRT